MINLFWSIPQRFFHNEIAWPELAFNFNVECSIISSKAIFADLSNVCRYLIAYWHFSGAGVDNVEQIELSLA